VNNKNKIMRKNEYISLWLKDSLGIDKAVAYSVAGKTWSMFAGLITILIISIYATKIEQGYFYTFQSLLAFQILFDLGLASILSQFAAHEMAKLSWTNNATVDGDDVSKSRLSSIILLVIKWYSIAAILMGLIITTGGSIFFIINEPIEKVINWTPPWVMICMTASILMALTPILGIIEGCGKVEEIAKVRLIQDIFGYTILWTGLFFGIGLYALPMMYATKIATQLIYLIVKRRIFILDLISTKLNLKVNFEKEIWPFQWRFLISSLSSLVGYSMIVPIVFSFQGAEISGQLGMTFSIANALITICSVWINTKIPNFCKLISEKNFESLDYIFYKTKKQSFQLLIIASLLIMILVTFINQFYREYGTRIPDPITFALFIMASIVAFPNVAYSTYLRAYKKEVTLWANLTTAFITVILVYTAAQKTGLIYIAIVQLISGIILSVWVYKLYIINKIKWQK
jgi:O-antigen/teichoic acid export membrane protein